MSPRMMHSKGDQCTNQCCWWLVLYIKELCVGDHLSLDQRKIFVVRCGMFQGSKDGWKPEARGEGWHKE